MRIAIKIILMAAIFVALWTGVFGSMEHYFHITTPALYALAGYLFYPVFKLIEDRIVDDGN